MDAHRGKSQSRSTDGAQPFRLCFGLYSAVQPIWRTRITIHEHGRSVPTDLCCCLSCMQLLASVQRWTDIYPLVSVDANCFMDVINTLAARSRH